MPGRGHVYPVEPTCLARFGLLRMVGREHGRMRIEGEEAGRPIREVWLQLTRTEAERLNTVLGSEGLTG